MMTRRLIGWLVLVLLFAPGLAPADDRQASVEQVGDHLTMTWPSAPAESGRVVLNLAEHQPLIERVDLGAQTLLSQIDPAAWLVVGSRVNPPPTPSGMSVFNVFFDNPLQRPHQTHRVAWSGPKTARIVTQGARASVAVGPIAAGPFRGEWVITVYAGSRLLHVEAVLKTDDEARAITYDAGLVERLASTPGQPHPIGANLAWIDTQDRWQRRVATNDQADQPHAVRHRTIVRETAAGSVACFPAPHQYFFPRDFTDNLSTTWSGSDHRGLAPGEFGFGIRQPETGGGNYVPWFNAPPGTDQRLGVFYLLHPGNAEATLADVLKFTHGDRFVEIPGYKTFSSHYHMAFTVEAMRQKAAGIDPPAVHPLVGVFKGLGVNAVHVAEFHGDGHPFDPGPLRLPELNAMFAECRRLSDDQLLVVPGEEANLNLGFGGRAGHWLEMFPKPVPFTMKRTDGQPLQTDDGVYHIKNPEDLLEVLVKEKGLAWTAHPRIKASNFAPDIYKDADFFRSDRWLGASWKAMPADLSRPRLGDRCLDLLDAMSNWGAHKQLLGEVDTFQLNSTHEMYAHMNVNYIKLDKLPRFDDGWQPILDALRAGQFFVTTGEILLHSAGLSGGPGQSLAEDFLVQADVEWTFPLQFAEVISGDGTNVYRDRLDLTQTPAFGRQTVKLSPDLKGRKWVRFAVWDIAANGAFSQPIWLDDAK